MDGLDGLAVGFFSADELKLEYGAVYISGIVTLSTAGIAVYKGAGFTMLIEVGVLP